MPRRALRKLKAAVDLSRHLRTLDQLPQPFDAEAVFGRAAPLEIEVGSGKGLFLGAAAAAELERNFLGCEVAGKYAAYAAARLAQRELANAVMLQGDANKLFGELLPNGIAERVHVYFPDPWWKARHRRRRIMSEVFLVQVARVLKVGGTLHFWTDVEEYFHTSLALLATLPMFSSPQPVAERPAEHDLDYRTHFERRMRMHGLPIYRSEFLHVETQRR
jgi:tRNA (guanine-N7-)-methyltransferase